MSDGEVLRHDLRPGDVIVFRSTRNLSMEEAHRIKERMGAEFPDNKCLVLAAGFSLEIVRPEDQE